MDISLAKRAEGFVREIKAKSPPEWEEIRSAITSIHRCSLTEAKPLHTEHFVIMYQLVGNTECVVIDIFWRKEISHDLVENATRPSLIFEKPAASDSRLPRFVVTARYDDMPTEIARIPDYREFLGQLRLRKKYSLTRKASLIRVTEVMSRKAP